MRFDAEWSGDVAPFTSVLLLSESASWSQIENLTSNAKSIALAELGSPDKRDAAAIVGNVAAMKAALDLADRLDENAVLRMHAALLADLLAFSARSDLPLLAQIAVAPAHFETIHPRRRCRSAWRANHR